MNLFWSQTKVRIDKHTEENAIAPLIISASRSTDIPALFGEWFIEQFKRGFTEWYNPFNGRKSFVSFENTRLIVFWSKNIKPFLKSLDEFDKRNINYFFHLTINDYEEEGFETNIPSLKERIETLKSLSSLVGREKIFWRFDPLILTEKINSKKLVEKIEHIGEKIAGYVYRLTVSFLSTYPSVVKRMKKRGIFPLEPQKSDICEIATKLAELGRKWNIEIFSCAESRDLKKYGIAPGSCIDPVYIIKMFSKESEIIELIEKRVGRINLISNNTNEIIRKKMKDPGQRSLCGCMISKDIGRYGTCTNGCIYCYAQNKILRFT
ncbi:MAG: DUF1848 domain-containing protein [Chitinispirillaceae bacterium]|nr:DUF1848 domain-containing protein [Chitinispirillaceae bacterium]